ncbi:Mannosyl-Oligosaccharide Glucosidase [Manis pentadactyla]|nr:Mannosyl-Oligosaccharide Glucosidase [Manis pentadactyla]
MSDTLPAPHWLADSELPSDARFPSCGMDTLNQAVVFLLCRGSLPAELTKGSPLSPGAALRIGLSLLLHLSRRDRFVHVPAASTREIKPIYLSYSLYWNSHSGCSEMLMPDLIQASSKVNFRFYHHDASLEKGQPPIKNDAPVTDSWYKETSAR